MLEALYHEVIGPTVTYISSVWLKSMSFKNIRNKLHMVQKHFLTKILIVKCLASGMRSPESR